MRAQLEAITAELRRLKADGGRSVSVSEEALAQLRQVVREQLSVEGKAPATAANVPSSVATERPAPSPAARMIESAPAPTPVRAAAKPTLDPSIPANAPVVTLPPGDKATQWAALKALVEADPVCRAHVGPGKKIVLGGGDLDAKIFFCGEAPGAEEEVAGEPFVGPAGQLLTRMIQGMGLKREQVYIGNIMNWRPDLPSGVAGVQVGNRAPTAQEMNYCLPYLRAQLAIVQPALIVALGATAAGGLLGAGTFKTLGEIKGRWHEFAGTPVMVTYHPSYILRNNSNRSKRSIWEDLLQVMTRAGLPVSDKQRGFFL